MRILGIDPGLSATGYGVIDTRGGRLRLIISGAIRTNQKDPISNRLRELFTLLTTIIKNSNPESVALEEAFYAKNVKVALTMGQARGAVMVAAATANLPVYEYSTREVKQAVVGNGGASKEQVQFMVKNLLGENQLKSGVTPTDRGIDCTTYDTSDALAVALCHAFRFPAQSRAHSKPVSKFGNPAVGAFN